MHIAETNLIIPNGTELITHPVMPQVSSYEFIL